MSISMECFESHGHFATYDAYPRSADRELIFQVQCHFCGYEAPDAVSPPKFCPKCNAASWERFAKPGSILKNAERYVA
jgi:predicted Zn-ribbon and HTH transcriptional regulator